MAGRLIFHDRSSRMVSNGVLSKRRMARIEGHYMCFVYILKCNDGSLYVGSTHNVEERLRAHNLGNGALFTAQRRPVRLVYKEPFEHIEDALKREHQIKKWSRAKKEALIDGDFSVLRNLSKRKKR